MKTYQTLSLIGCIIGLFLMLFLFGVAGVGTIFNNASMNLTKQYGNSSQLAIQTQRHAESEKVFSAFAAGTAFSLVLFIVSIPATFLIKKTKVIGIMLIVIAVITTAITNGWGIIPLALLLPAGILAIKQKKLAQITP